MFVRKFIAIAGAGAIAWLPLRAAEPSMSIAEILGEVATPEAVEIEEPYTDTLAPLEPDTLADNFVTAPLPRELFLPALYMPFRYDLDLTDSISAAKPSDNAAWEWLTATIRARAFGDRMRQDHAITHPADVHLNLYSLPEPPKAFVLTADPETATYVFTEVPSVTTTPVEVAIKDLRKQHWLNKFGTNIQFSQAFISPNWYQGGNSSLNMIADFTYQSNLNTKFHPKLLFENFFQWRTALQSTQEDPYRDYSLTENRFQINTKFGYKAAANWYYTITGMLKTPVFNGYKTGTQTRTASFFSPGEVNFGAGMTYNFKNKKENFTLGVTVSPISYNLKACIDRKIDETSFGIKKGRKTLSSYGSSAEITWNWKICYNVAYNSRVFAFTNYEYFQGDWQNQFQFTINRFLTANLNIDLRYDTSVKPAPDAKWRQLQLREVFSLGFTHYFHH